MVRFRFDSPITFFLGDVVAFCLGFLGSFEAEVKRFKDIVQIMDNKLNKQNNNF